MQCYPCPVIWQPSNLADQPANNFVALENGLRASYPLVSIFTLAVDFQDETGYIPSSGVPAITGITGPLSAWFGAAPTYSTDKISAAGEGSAIFTGAEGGLKADAAGMLNPATLAFTVWFKFSSKVGAQRIVNYAATGGGTVFALRYSSVADRLNFHVLDAGQAHEAIITAATLGAPAVDTWYFAYCYYDAATRRAGILVTADTDGSHQLPATDEGAVASGKFSTGGQFNIAYGPLAERFKGKVYSVSIWARTLNPLEVARVLHSGGWGWAVFTPAAGEAGVAVEATAPAAPSGLDVSGDATSIQLESFTDNNVPGTYENEVWISDVTGQNWELVETLALGDLGGIWDGDYFHQSVRVRAIGRGNPSAWVTAYAPDAYYFAYGSILLQADDEQWYFVSLSTDAEGVTTIDFGDDPPTPQSPPPYGKAFLSLLIGATAWGAHLVFDQDGKLSFDLVQDGENAIASIPLASDNGNSYAVTMELDDDQNPTLIPSQTPIDS